MSTKKKTDYTSNSQQRILRLLLLLAGREFTGVTPSELAKAAATTPSNITRDLHNLRHAGLAEEIPDANGRWRLGPKLVQIALAHMNCRERAQARMQELDRYTRRQP